MRSTMRFADTVLLAMGACSMLAGCLLSLSRGPLHGDSCCASAALLSGPRMAKCHGQEGQHRTTPAPRVRSCCFMWVWLSAQVQSFALALSPTEEEAAIRESAFRCGAHPWDVHAAPVHCPLCGPLHAGSRCTPRTPSAQRQVACDCDRGRDLFMEGTAGGAHAHSTAIAPHSSMRDCGKDVGHELLQSLLQRPSPV